MRLEPSARLGPYEIVSPLGAGGMGEVYRARDTRLGREVAVKVLSGERASSDEFRRRFAREARAISSLTHPNICALFDVGSEGDISYLVMELLEGETLSGRLAKGRIPFAQVLGLGAEIASALGAAHAAGIVHRDLKPANIMLTRSGARLLDFGLARILKPPVADENLSSASTASASVTLQGSLLGTVPYMAPEQLEGKVVDARADLFALGAVLFEMATGRKAFGATNHAALISAILSSEPPPVSSLQPASPPLFDRVVSRCLAKDPGARWNSAHDLSLHLREISEMDAMSGSARPEVASRRGAWLSWGFAAALLVLGGAVLVRGTPHPVAHSGAVRFTVPPPAGAGFYSSQWANGFAVSPDGSQLAFVAADSSGVRRIWIRPLAALEPRQLAGSDDATSLFWSPDGGSIAFFAAGTLKRLDLAGGAPVSICSVSSVGDCSGTWGRGGDILFTPHQEGPIYRVAATGGAPSVMVREDGARFAFPWFLPDGERFLCFKRRDDGNDSLMMGALGRTPRGILAGVSMAQFAQPGHLVYVRDGTLLGQRFEPASGRLAGAPQAITPHVRNYLSTGWAAYAISSGGTLAYGSSENVVRLVFVDRRGRELGTVGSPGSYHDLTIAPDGRRVLCSRDLPTIGTGDLWSLDLARGLETRLTSDRRSEFSGVWLPGEKSVVYSSAQGGPPFHLTRLDLDTNRYRDFLPTRHFQTAQDVSPDGRSLVYTERNAGLDEIWRCPLLDGGAPSLVIQSPGLKQAVRFSPDGRFIAFISDESGRPEAYVTPFPGPGEKLRISRDGALQLRWCRATHEILYLSADRRLWSARVATTPSLQISAPSLLFEAKRNESWSDFDVMPDGQRILAMVPQIDADELPLTVVVNWASGLER
jgi:eukaryotic-like serine/threonine-protein kinase